MPADRPTVSFVLATYNRGTVMIDCLRRTLACGLPAKQFDIRIVDNASTDATAALVADLARDHANLRLIRLEKNCGPVAKNVGLVENDADIIVLLDDDAYPLPGAITQTIRHFQDDAHLGAAVFDVTLPDGSKEASAYPDIFIGAGTALRGSALRELAQGPAARRPGRGMLPADFFMQAEEYDLSFRLLAAGWSVQRFWDMPLMHLKTPGARIGERTTRLDVRNNLWLLARYVPEPLAQALAAEWLARYWRMAEARDGGGDRETRRQGEEEKRRQGDGETSTKHRAAFMRGAAEGLTRWAEQRGTGELKLGNETVERIFKFEAIANRLQQLKERLGLRRVALGDWGKNIVAYRRAADALGLDIACVIDGRLAGDAIDYHGIPVVTEPDFREGLEKGVDAIIVTALSPVHAGRRVAELRRTLRNPVLDLFARPPMGVPQGAHYGSAISSAHQPSMPSRAPQIAGARLS